MPRVILVERAPDQDANKLKTLAGCLEVREAKLLRIYRGVSSELAVYEAIDTEYVRDAYRSADVAFVRAWPADVE